MNRHLLYCLAVLLTATAVQAQITINDKQYAVDTIVHRMVGPGVRNTIVRLPDYPLNVYILETDLTNPGIRVEATIGQNTVGKTEALVNAAKRQTTATKRPFAACNANFWIVSGSGAPLNQYGIGTPLGCVVRNDTTYVNTNTSADQWDGGPARTGATAITRDGRAYVGRFMWYGKLYGDKINGTLDFYNINRRCLNNDLALWHPGYTRTREFENNWVAYNERGNNDADNYYLMFKDGSGWGVNKPMTFTVEKIVRDADRQTLGDYDACFTATGTYKQALANLAVGDEITVESQWRTNDPDREQIFPDIENMVEGNAYIMHNGELTNRNTNEEYNSMVYSRTCYGTNADGTRLYMLVIDKSTSKLYGQSAGCPTAVACQILKSLCPDVTEMVNYDAGGSAEMMLDGAIINTTTEGTPRAVASGMMLVATGEVDNQIASIGFEDYHPSVPVYSTYVPKIWGYNARGEVVSKDVKGVTLSCDPSLGTTEGDALTLGGNDVTALLTATLGSMTATTLVTALPAQPAIMVKPVIVLDDREYPVEVTATVGNKTFTYDATKLGWSVDDPTIAAIDRGTLRGLRTGTTTLRCAIGPMTDSCQVDIEISDTPYIYENNWTEWTLKGSGAKNLVLAEDGTLSYTYSSNRAPYIQLRKEIRFYSLPDTIALVFNSTIPMEYLQIDARNNFFTSTHYTKYSPAGEAFEPDVDHTILLDIGEFGGVDAVSAYPITLRELKFVPAKGAEAGEQTLHLKEIRCHYSKHSAPGDLNGDAKVDVSDLNEMINVMIGKADNPLADLDRSGTVDVADLNMMINLMLN